MKTATALTFLCIALGTPLVAFSASANPAATATPATPAAPVAPIAPIAPITNDKFVHMDTSKDGVVTWEEFHVSYPQMQQAAFDSIDANKDKAIDREEWNAFLAQHSMGRANTPGGMGGGGMGGMPPKAKTDMKGEGGPALMITPPAK